MARLDDPDLIETILARVAGGEGINKLAPELGFDPPTFRKRVYDDVDGLATRYARARDIGLDHMAEDLLRIADTQVEAIITREGEKGVEITRKDALEHRRLMVDTRKWYLSKIAPKRYGDRLDITSGDKPLARDPADTAAKAAALIAAALKRKTPDGGDLV